MSFRYDSSLKGPVRSFEIELTSTPGHARDNKFSFADQQFRGTG